MALLKVNGHIVEQYHDMNTPHDVVAQFVEENYGSDASFVIMPTVQEQRDKEMKSLRSEIQAQAGDTASLLGTTSDAVHLLLYEVAKLSQALYQAQSLQQVRSAAAPLYEILSSFATAVDAGEVRLPYRAKSTPVLADIEQRATAVHDQLQPNSAKV